MVTTTRPDTPRVEVLSIGTTFDEWVILAPVDPRHDALLRYLSAMLETYLGLRPIGELRAGGFMMSLGSDPYEPDILVILYVNPHRLTPTFMDGPADIAIEIVSPESVERDHGTKLAEYEKGKVPEYWIVDPIHREARFYRLGEDGVYVPQNEDADGNYSTPALPDLTIHVPELWQDDLPDVITLTQRVEDMLKD